MSDDLRTRVEKLQREIAIDTALELAPGWMVRDACAMKLQRVLDADPDTPTADATEDHECWRHDLEHEEYECTCLDAAADFTNEEAVALDRFMDDHMHGHAVSNSVAYWTCDTGCRTDALRRGVNKILEKRRAG